MVQESFQGKLLATRLQHESRGVGGKEETSGDDSQLLDFSMCYHDDGLPLTPTYV